MPSCFGGLFARSKKRNNPCDKVANRSRSQYTSDSARSEWGTSAKPTGVEASAGPPVQNAKPKVGTFQYIPEASDQRNPAHAALRSDDFDADTVHTGTLTRYHSADSGFTNFLRGSSLCGDDNYTRSEGSPTDTPRQFAAKDRSPKLKLELSGGQSDVIGSAARISPAVIRPQKSVERDNDASMSSQTKRASSTFPTKARTDSLIGSAAPVASKVVGCATAVNSVAFRKDSGARTELLGLKNVNGFEIQQQRQVGATSKCPNVSNIPSTSGPLAGSISLSCVGPVNPSALESRREATSRSSCTLGEADRSGTCISGIPNSELALQPTSQAGATAALCLLRKEHDLIVDAASENDAKPSQLGLITKQHTSSHVLLSTQLPVSETEPCLAKLLVDGKENCEHRVAYLRDFSQQGKVVNSPVNNQVLSVVTEPNPTPELDLELASVRSAEINAENLAVEAASYLVGQPASIGPGSALSDEPTVKLSISVGPAQNPVTVQLVPAASPTHTAFKPGAAPEPIVPVSSEVFREADVRDVVLASGDMSTSQVTTFSLEAIQEVVSISSIPGSHEQHTAGADMPCIGSKEVSVSLKALETSFPGVQQSSDHPLVALKLGFDLQGPASPHKFSPAVNCSDDFLNDSLTAALPSISTTHEHKVPTVSPNSLHASTASTIQTHIPTTVEAASSKKSNSAGPLSDTGLPQSPRDVKGTTSGAKEVAKFAAGSVAVSSITAPLTDQLTPAKENLAPPSGHTSSDIITSSGTDQSSITETNSTTISNDSTTTASAKQLRSTPDKPAAVPVAVQKLNGKPQPVGQGDKSPRGGLTDESLPSISMSQSDTHPRNQSSQVTPPESTDRSPTPQNDASAIGVIEEDAALAPLTPEPSLTPSEPKPTTAEPSHQHHHFHAPNLARLSKKVSEKISHALHHTQTPSRDSAELHSDKQPQATSPSSLKTLSHAISEKFSHHAHPVRAHSRDSSEATSRNLSMDEQHATSPLHRLSRKITDKVSYALHHAHPHSPKQSMELPAEKPVASPRSVFLEEYDRCFLAFCNKVYGVNVESMEELPVLPVAPWNRRPGYLGYLTAEQTKALKWIRKVFPDSVKFHSDHDILRFLRARDFDLRETKIMYDKYLKKYRGHALCSPSPPVRPTIGAAFKLDLFSMLPERSPDLTRKCHLMFDYFLHVVIFGTDREGRPVAYLKPGASILHHMKDHVLLEDRVALQCASIEASRLLLHMVSVLKGYHVEEMVHVVDLAGLGPIDLMNHVRTADAQAEFSYNTDFNPESLFKVVIINAPFGSQAVWKAASVFLPPRTRSKFTILGKQYQADLRKQIGVENMPSCYGGKIPFDWQRHKPVRTLRYKA